MTTTLQLITKLNSADAIANGLSNADARETAPGVVSFSYPAPVLSGSCEGTLTINADGSIYDDIAETTHADFAAFVVDLNAMMEI